LRKLTLEQIVERLKTLNPTVTILSTEYGGCETKLKCFCNIHQTVWYTKYSNLAKGCGCPKCLSEKIGNALRKDFDILKEQVKEVSPNILITSKEYVNSHTKLDCFCTIHDVSWQVSASDLLASHGCPKCASIKIANGRRLNYEDVKDRLSVISPNLTLISDEYVSAKDKLKLHCVCGNDFESTWSGLSQGTNCPICSLRLMSGHHSNLWKGGISILSQYIRGGLSSWKNDTEKKYNKKCAITGEPFNEIHHIIGFNKILEETMQISELPLHPEIGYYTREELIHLRKINLDLHYKYGLGVCLTEDIHKEFHKIYGYGDNTPEQFEEFKNNYKAS